MLTRGRKSKNKITKEATKKQTHGRRKKENTKGRGYIRQIKHSAQVGPVKSIYCYTYMHVKHKTENVFNIVLNVLTFYMYKLKASYFC